MIWRAAIIFFTVLLLWRADAAELKEVIYSTAKPIKASRFLFDQEGSGPKAPFAVLLQAKKAALADDYKTCLAKLAPIDANKKTDLSIVPWVENQRLSCHRKLLNGQKNRPDRDQIKQAWLLVKRTAPLSQENAPYAEAVRRNWTDLARLTLEQLSVRNRGEAWENLFLAVERLEFFRDADKSEIFRIGGEMALLESKKTVALDYFQKSFLFRKSDRMAQKVALLQKEMNLNTSEPLPIDESTDAPVEATDDKEEELWKKYLASVRSRDMVSTAEDGVALLSRFPGTRHSSEIFDRLKSITVAISTQKDEKLRLLKESVYANLRKAPPAMVLAWGKTLGDRENFQDAILLAEPLTESVQDRDARAEALLFTGQMYGHIAEFESAKEKYEALLETMKDTKAAPAAEYRLGLVMYRLKNFAGAVAHFENYVARKENDTYRVSALYWLYRAKVHSGSGGADEIRETLLAEYPLSYFGLRVFIEKNDGQMKFGGGTPNEAWKLQLWMTPTEYSSWQRFKDLLEANWFDEAQIELRSIPEPKTAAGLLAMSQLWALALNYHEATNVAAKAWALDRATIDQPSLVLVYQCEFASSVAPQAARYKLPDALLYSLIRQESQFRPYVESPAGALGLMQVLRGTGREIAKDLKLKGFNADRDLRVPATNVRVGANYLSRMIKAFSGHVPLALGAYNAGIGNIRVWMKNRKDLSYDVMSNADPDSEIWMDELPWSETTGYIRNILRNWMIYRYLDRLEQGRLVEGSESKAELSAEKISFPIWSISP